MTQTPAGWYPDPSNSAQQRYFDGTQWTQHVNPGAPQQAQAAGQAHGQAPQAQAAPQPPQGQAQVPPQAQGQHAHQAQAVPPAQAQAPQTYGQGGPGHQGPPQGYPHQTHAPEQRSDLERIAELDVSGVDTPERIHEQIQRSGAQGPAAQGGGTLFTEPVLVVNQKAKLIEINNEYAVYNQHGQQLAAVVQVGQSAVKKVVRFLGNYDQFFTHKLEIRDGHGQVLLRVTRPRKFMKSRVIVERGDGSPIGEIAQQNVFGKINFSMTVNGQEYGQIKAENWRAWNFAIVDHTGAEVARITKTFEGIAKAVFTTADNYVLHIHRPLQDPFLSMVVASALTVDTALKQDDR